MESERSDLTSTQGTPCRLARVMTGGHKMVLTARVLLLALASLLLAGTGVYLYLLDQEGDHGGDHGGDQKVVSVVGSG